MQKNQKTKRVIGIALAAAIALGAAVFLAACKKDGDGASGSSPTNPTLEFTLETPDNLQHYAGKLVIGTPGALQNVDFELNVAPSKVDAKVLLETLANETGWNLDTAEITWADAITVQIAFAAEASIFAGPPDPQKDAYHVFDSSEMVLTALNSIAETLAANQCGSNYRFTAADGGPLNIEGFTWAADQNWDYAAAAKAFK
ncbi:MAG: hypothetical protein LBS96_00105 [Oscillospiraceae bacterium]|jgi:hypothetical protein|nr:hypothetical protein [Oscillospiraceae bacterium]